MSTYVMIPGGGHGAWAWQPVGRRLCSWGHRVVPVTLPGMGACESRTGHRLADAVDHVVSVVEEQQSDDVRVVAHSLGGIVAAGVAARLRNRLAEIVFVSAQVPVPGESFATAGPGSDISQVMSEDEEVASSISLDALATTLMQGVDEAVQRLVHDLLVPTPGRYTTDPYDGPDLRTLGIAMRYLAGADDRALVRPAAELAARVGVAVETVPGTHEALLTHPEAIATAILASAGPADAGG